MANTEVDTTLFGTDVSYEIDSRWLAYWSFLLRIVVGWWFLHAGLGKLIGDGITYDAGGWLANATDVSIIAPLLVWTGENIPVIAGTMVQWGQIAIGLGLIVGLLVRTASFFGVMLMIFFTFGNVEWSTGMVGANLMGLLLFVTVIVLGAGRVWGLDAYVEKTPFVQNNQWMRYLLG
ncbi:MAG: DoxX family protein [Halorhabdus sp.]